jgi:Na+/H+-translocating membrane pyrophosphatase
MFFLILAFFSFSATPEQVINSVDKIPMLIIGFGFGASFVAMFAQLGGGIYTKVEWD